MCGEFPATLSDIKGTMVDMQVKCGGSVWLAENKGLMKIILGIVACCIIISGIAYACNRAMKELKEEREGRREGGNKEKLLIYY